MIMLFHISVAIASILFTTHLFLEPSEKKLKISYGLVGFTLASGTYLVISTHANMVHACITGLIYTAIISFGIIVARNKLATQE